jgi:hypothetical protein
MKFLASPLAKELKTTQIIVVIIVIIIYMIISV